MHLTVCLTVYAPYYIDGLLYPRLTISAPYSPLLSAVTGSVEDAALPSGQGCPLALPSIV